jgi:hypothetical protein
MRGLPPEPNFGNMGSKWMAASREGCAFTAGSCFQHVVTVNR